MNRTHAEHALYALLMQGVVWVLTGSAVAGACFGYAFFLGREHAQFEYKIGDPSTLNPLAGFAIWKWSRDAQLDLAAPAAAVLTVCLLSANF